MAAAAFRGYGAALRTHVLLYALRQSRLANNVVTPAVMSSLAVFMLRGAAPSHGALRVLVGGGMVGMWSSLLGTAAFTVRREREAYGTFSLLAATPTPLAAIFAGYLTAEAITSLVGVVVSVAAGWLILGNQLHVDVSLLFLVSVVFCAAALASLALVVAPLMVLAPILTRWVNAFDMPIWILAGLMFPISLLPGWTNPLSFALAPYWAALALERSGAGAGLAQVAPLWGFAAVTAVLYGLIAAGVFQRVVVRIRRSGKLIEGA